MTKQSRGEKEEYSFVVITKVPLLTEANKNDNNFADDFLAKVGDKWYMNEGLHEGLVSEKIKSHSIIQIKVPVFLLAELIVCHKGGREIGYPMRAPYKWGHLKGEYGTLTTEADDEMEYEEFDNLDEAIKRSKEVWDSSWT